MLYQGIYIEETLFFLSAILIKVFTCFDIQ